MSKTRDDNYLKKELYELIKTDEKIFDFIQESSLDGMWYWDLENPENEWMNPKFWTVLGYNPDEMPHKSSAWQNIINQDDLKLAIENFTRHCQDPNHPYNQIVRYTHKNGSTVWIRCRGMAIRNESGKPVRMLGAHQDITEEKLLQSDIEKSTQIYKNIIQSIPIGMFIYEYVEPDKLYLIEGNSSAQKLTGINVSDWVGREFNEIWPNARHDGITDSYLKVAKTGNSIELEDTYYTDERVSGAFRIYAFQFDKNKIAIAFLNVTENKKAEENLIVLNKDLVAAKERAEKSEERFLLAMKASNDGLFDWNLETNEIYYSPGWKKMLGYEDHELPNDFSIWEKTTDPEDVKKSWELQHKLITKQIDRFVTEFKMKHKDGHWINILARAEAVFDESGKAVRIVGTHTDITKRKQAEEALLTNEIRYKSAQKLGKVGNWEYNINTGDFWGSDEAKRIYGFDLNIDNFSTETVENCIPDRDRVHQALIDLIEKGAEYNLEFQIFPINSNQPKTIVSIAELKKDAKGVPVSVVGVVQDITERKQYEMMLEEKSEEIAAQNEEYLQINDELNYTNLELFKAKEKAEQSDSLKTAFLQNVSHEIRTPMNAIMGFSSLLPKNYNNKEKLESFSKIIELRCNDLLDIINDLLDISKIESGQNTLNIENCNLNELFGELSLFFKDYKERINKQNIQVHFNPAPEGSLHVMTDRLKLKQILFNLVSNALKYTESGSVTCSYKLEEGKIQFYVQDTGIGIPGDKHEFIFERFAQLKHKTLQNLGGTGLGLPIVKGLVKLLGGNVWLESECNVGTTFYFTIEYNKGNSTGVIQSVIDDKNEIITDKTILIVEDDFYNAEYLKEILSSNIKSNIVAVTDGMSAVNIVQQQKIDIILMDIRLPDITGYEATRLILQHNPEIKIIAQTAYAANTEHQIAIDAGCVDYISKPTKQEHLLKLIAKYL